MTHAIAVRGIKNKTVLDYFGQDWLDDCLKDLDPGTHFWNFNTGVMVQDLKQWRANPMFTRRLEDIASACLCNDQPSFNVVFMNNVDHFDRKWNDVGLGRVQLAAKHDGKVLHWSGPVKPWSEPDRCKLSAEIRAKDPECLSKWNTVDY